MLVPSYVDCELDLKVYSIRADMHRASARPTDVPEIFFLPMDHGPRLGRVCGWLRKTQLRPNSLLVYLLRARQPYPTFYSPLTLGVHYTVRGPEQSTTEEYVKLDCRQTLPDMVCNVDSRDGSCGDFVISPRVHVTLTSWGDRCFENTSRSTS